MGDLVKASISDYVTVLAVAGLAALGGAFAVYAGYDDAPGGVLIGFALIIGAAALGMRSVRRRSWHSQSSPEDTTTPR
jgi:hypothetical protein